MPAQEVPLPRGWQGIGHANVQRQDFGRRHKYDEASGESFDYAGNDGDMDDSNHLGGTVPSDENLRDTLDDPRSYRTFSGEDTYHYTEE